MKKVKAKPVYQFFPYLACIFFIDAFFSNASFAEVYSDEVSEIFPGVIYFVICVLVKVDP